MAARKRPPYTLEQARPLLEQATAAIAEAIKLAHPEEGCLPLPELPVPGSVEELTNLSTSLCENLFAPNGSPHEAWIRARRCPHGDQEQVTQVSELLYRWYQAVNCLIRWLRASPSLAFVDWPAARGLEDLQGLHRELDAITRAAGRPTDASRDKVDRGGVHD